MFISRVRHRFCMSRRLFAACAHPDYYMSDCNIDCLQAELYRILGVRIERGSIRMVMKNILDDPTQFQGLEQTNNRVLYYIVQQYRGYVHQGTLHRAWADHFRDSQLLINPYGKTGPDFNAVKIANRLGCCLVGGGMSFYFT